MASRRAKGWTAWRSGVRRAAGLGLGAALALGAAVTSADGNDPCSAIQISVDKDLVLYGINKCSAGARAYGTAALPKDYTLLLNGANQTLVACGEKEPHSDGELCFPLSNPLSDITLSVKDASQNLLKFKESKATSEKVEAKEMVRATPPPPSPAGSGPSTGTRRDPPPAPGTDPCAPFQDQTADQLALCYAYVDAIEELDGPALTQQELDDIKEKEDTAAKKAAEAKRDARARDVARWMRSRGHIERRGDNEYALFFNSEGVPITPVPQIDENDKVVIVVVSTDGAKPIKELRVTSCKGADPARIGGSAVVPSPGPVKPERATLLTPEQIAQAKVAHRISVVKGCSSDGGIAAVTRLEGETASHDIKVTTLSVYRFTVGLGFIYDFTHDVEFRAAAVKGESVPIIVRDEHIRGLTAPPVFISWRPWPVDMARVRRFWWPEWFGLTLGVSLTEPLDHLYGGVIIEPLPGIGAVVGAHLHTVKSLAGGYQVGDRFSGGTDVPVDKRWQFKETMPFVGLTLDSTVFSKLLKVIQ